MHCPYPLLSLFSIFIWRKSKKEKGQYIQKHFVNNHLRKKRKIYCNFRFNRLIHFRLIRQRNIYKKNIIIYFTALKICITKELLYFLHIYFILYPFSWISIYKYIFLYINLYIYLSINRYICLSINRYIYLSINLSVI